MNTSVDAPNQKYGLEFGSGSFVGSLPDDFFDYSAADQARALGWAHGCPIVEELLASDQPGCGSEAMRSRYAEVNFWSGFMSDTVKALNPHLHHLLITPMPRYENQSPKHYEPESVPASYLAEMAPMDTLVGYALPRVMIEQLNGNKQSSKGQQPLRSAWSELWTFLRL